MELINSSVVAATPAAKISRAFAHAREEGHGVLMPYFMCGYPSAAQTVQVVLAAAKGGAGIIELGMPFSDPLADGVTIQHAGQIALERGMTMQGCLEIASQIAAQSTVPLLLMGYYNPLLSYGLERFCAAASTHGVSGLIIPDLPPEEADPLQEAAQRHGLALVFLIPPTTPNERLEKIAARAASEPDTFIYCVSLSGVTGSRKELPPHLRDFIARVRVYTKDRQIPLAVGFGLSTPEHVAQVMQIAEGAVVGSALVNLLDQYEISQQAEAVRQYIQSLVQK